MFTDTLLGYVFSLGVSRKNVAKYSHGIDIVTLFTT